VPFHANGRLRSGGGDLDRHLHGGGRLLPGNSPEFEAGEVLYGCFGEEEDAPQAQAGGLPQGSTGQVGAEAPAAIVRAHGQGAQQAVGAVFVNQREDLLASIQRLRQAARDAQNLQNSPEQQVIVTPEAIQILPADPDIIYVPRYDPAMVYVWTEGPHVFPYITFGIGHRVGIWLDCSLDWDHHWVAIGGGWHQGWVYENRQWRHDDRVRIDQRTILYRNHVKLPVPALPT
jgi:hypothetical protein